jgi:hypothetical protein
MKKVININFQGRVIPIEETAFDLLKQYIDSLRSYFAREEGRDEIINDIESRIAELFSERLKKGAVCITDQDVNEISASIGRPEDFEDDGGTAAKDTGNLDNSSPLNRQLHNIMLQAVADSTVTPMIRSSVVYAAALPTISASIP